MRRAALLIGLVGVVGLVIIGAGVASAASSTWTVCPSGCNYTDIQTAISNASTLPGDTIDIKASGSPYTVNNVNHVNDTKQLIIQGDPAGPRPVITDSTAGDTPFTVNIPSPSSKLPNTVIQHLEIDATGSGSPTAVNITGKAEGQNGPDGQPVVLRDAVVNSSGVGVAMDAGQIQQATINGTTDGVTSGVNGGFVSGAVVTASAGTALLAMKTNKACTGSCNPPHDLQAVNVDAIAKGAGFGMEAQGTPDTTVNYAGTIAATNVIARGGTADISGDPAPVGPNPLAGQAFVDHTNFVSGTGITSVGAGNQNGDPKFVNGTIGPSQNFHLQPGSPAIAAGTVDQPFSTIDADGNPFFSPPEIGAYRAVHPSNPQPTCSGAFVYPGLKTHKKAKGRKGKAHKQGVITISFHFPCAGKLKITATAKQKKKGHHKAKKVSWAKVISVSRNAAGLVVINLKPNGKGKKLLAQARRKHTSVKVTVSVQFTSFLGIVSKGSRTIKVK